MSIIEIKVPQIGEAIKEVTLNSWLKENGSFVQRDEIICSLDSDKASIDVPAEQAGTLIWVAAEGDDIAIGGMLAKIDTSSVGETTAPAKTAEKTVEKTAEKTVETSNNTTYASGHPSPAARKILEENKVDAANITGSGKDGRITKEDAVRAADNKISTEKTTAAPATKTETVVAAPAAPAVAFSRNVREEKMSRMRRTIAKRLVSAKNNTAMLTTFNEVDMTGILELRKKYQDDFVAKYGIKLGFMSIFAKACAKVLMEMPEVNAQISEDGNSIIYHDFADISIAISTPTGLVVPPVQNIESRNLAQIEFAIADLAKKARAGSLTLAEMSGGTFTITNGGVFGSMMSTPIINEPQSAILGMHATIERPVAINGKVEIRPMMYLALSYDHRVIDGSSSVTFLVKVKKLLEDPTRLLLDI
jgi:2-oxoglutarate dehydrogenase E2 component (dihydrolipoamide succinyltransferase)